MKDIEDTALNLNIPTNSAVRAWENFSEFKNPELNIKSGELIGKKQFATPKIKCNRTKQNPSLTKKEAAQAILYYMNNRTEKIASVCNKFDMSIGQYYDIIRELNISGRLTTTHKERTNAKSKTAILILNPKKYAKTDVKDAIAFKKFNGWSLRTSIQKSNPHEMGMLLRVGTVLEQYLTAVK